MPRMPSNLDGTATLGDEGAPDSWQHAAWEDQIHFSTTYPDRESQMSTFFGACQFLVAQKESSPTFPNGFGSSEAHVLQFGLTGFGVPVGPTVFPGLPTLRLTILKLGCSKIASRSSRFCSSGVPGH